MSGRDVAEKLDQWRVASRNEPARRSWATVRNPHRGACDEIQAPRRHRNDQHLGDQRPMLD